jgi:hypothetical protein
MNDARDRLIDDLVADLRPVRHAGRTGTATATWLALATLYSVLMVHVTGPWRTGAWRDLVDQPLFAVETLVAVLAILSLAVAGLRSAIPGGRTAQRRLMWAALPACTWMAIYFVGLWHPFHPVSTEGDREVCLWQVMLFTLPTLALMLWFARRQFPLWPRLTGLMAGAASAAIPAALMQFACMYEPHHILLYHVGPMLPAAAFGAWIGPHVLKVRNVVPRRREASLH